MKTEDSRTGKHTPAPWAVEPDHDDDIEGTWMIHGAADAPGLTPVALVYTADAFPCVDDEDRAAFEAECEANARLIAAAPDLLIELEKAQEDVCSLHCPSQWKTGERPPHSDRCQAISAALAKAKARGD